MLGSLRFGWIWSQVDMIKNEDIIAVVLLAVGEWVVARNLFAVTQHLLATKER